MELLADKRPWTWEFIVNTAGVYDMAVDQLMNLIIMHFNQPTYSEEAKG